MAMDSIAVYAVAEELTNKIKGGIIDKIYQPEKDELIFSVRTFSDSFKLTISASSSNARIHLGNIAKENPKTAPMFCMLLRKYLQGGKIIQINQQDFERVLKITISARNTLGDTVNRYLICEMTGRNSNIILLDENDIIKDAIRRVDITQSSVRNILPGIKYCKIPKQDKISILDIESEIKLNFEKENMPVYKYILNQIAGIGQVTAREFVFEVTKRTDTMIEELTKKDKEDINNVIKNFRKEVLEGKMSPSLIVEKQTDRLIDFSATEVNQYGESVYFIQDDSMSEVILKFYHMRDIKERMRQKSLSLQKLISSNIERLSRKLVIQENTLKDAENKDEYKKKADLITASIYKIKQGEERVELVDFFDENMPTINISLSKELTPSQNAQKYYKKYNKAKNAIIEVNKQLKATKEEMEYLESALVLIENALTVEDIKAIKAELSQQGYIKSIKNNNKNKKETKTSVPYHFKSSDGFDIYVGKNNIQNDILTLKTANSQDIWFHTKKIHGSHTIIKLGIDKDVPKTTMQEAARLAAYFSKARESSQVPVDYTTVKNVKKPNGAKPGMVIYDYYNTVYVDPKSPEELNLKQIK